MNVSKEFLMEAVGLSMLVVLILINMQFFQRTVKITALLEESQERQISQLEEYEIVKYDGMRIDGMTAISYIKKMTGIYELPVRVETILGEFLVMDRSECEELRKISSEKYINPMANYSCEVKRDANEVIYEIIIRVEKEGE